MFHGAGAPLPTDQWIRHHYPFGGYGQAPTAETFGVTVVKYALAFAIGWIANTYYEKQGPG
jgi:hypothetical protein